MRKKNLTKMVKTLSVALAVTMGLGLTSVPVQAAPKSGLVQARKKTVYSKKKPLSVYIGGKKMDLDLLVKGRNKKNKVSWKSQDSSILKVNKNGKITPIKNGTVVVEARYNKKKYYALIQVKTRADQLMIMEKGEEKPLSEVKMRIGETKTFKLEYGLSDKVKVAGGVESTYNSYVTEGSGEVVKVNKMDGLSDFITITALKEGETNVEVWANQTSEAKVKGKYGIKANLKVVVEADFNGKQTGEKKITVKGSNLSSDVKAYTVMVNGSKRDITAVTLSSDGKEAILNMTGALEAGSYSVEFSGKKSTFVGEKAKPSKIDVPNKYLVLKGDFPSTEGSVEYQILNQFGEEVTKSVSTLTVHSTIGTVAIKPNEGKLVITGIPNTLSLKSQVNLNFVNQDPLNFFNGNFQVVLSEKAKASSVEVKGIYDSVKKVPYKFAVNSATENANARLLIEVKNQYGGRLTSTEGMTLSFNPGLTGLGMDTASVHNTLLTVDGVDYIAIPFTGTAGVKVGKANLMMIALYGTSGNNIKNYEFDVVGTKQVGSFSVNIPAQVYAKEKTYFNFTAKNTAGEEIKDYATLSNPNFGVKLPAGFKFENMADGSARLVYDANLDTLLATITWGNGLNEIDTSAVFTIAANSQPVVVQFKVQAPALPANVKSFKPDGALLGTETDNVLRKIAILDNKGREHKNLSLFGDYYIGISGDLKNFGVVNVGGSQGSANNKVTLFKISSLATSSLKFVAPSSISLPYVEEGVVFAIYKDATGSNIISGSEMNVKLTASDVKNLSTYEIKLPSVLYSGRTSNPAHVEASDTGNIGYHAVKIQVVGKAGNGENIFINEENYTVSDSENIWDSVTKTLKTSKLAYKATKEGKVMDTISVIVNDGKGSPTTKVVEVSSELPTVKEVNVLTDEITAADLNADIKMAVLKTLELKDRYTAEEFGVQTSTAVLKSSLKGMNVLSKTGGITVDWNNTGKITVSGAAAGDLITLTVNFEKGISKTLSYRIK